MTKQENNEDNKGLKQNKETVERITSPAERELSPSPILLPISRRVSRNIYKIENRTKLLYDRSKHLINTSDYMSYE